MASYISQTEAAIYVSSFADMPATKALALLSAASGLIDSYCKRTFETEGLEDPVKYAVALTAEWIATTNTTGGTITSERIGDYQVSYAAYIAKDMPLTVQLLLAPYRIIAVA